MTKKDIAKLLAIIAAAYPQFEANDLKVSVWQEMLGDLNYELVQQAVKICILRSDFPPSIAAIRKSAADLASPDKLSAAEAWGMVINAIRHYGSYRSVDAFKSMPLEVTETAKLMGWQEMCRAENVEVIRGQFIKLYESQSKRAAERAILPEEMKAAAIGSIKQIAGGR
jgi:hypothetical protein